MNELIKSLEQEQLKNEVPAFGPGDTVRVHVKIVEGKRERVQVFEGVVIKRQGGGNRETFTVRKISFNVGVERTFPVHSPKIEKIEVNEQKEYEEIRKMLNDVNEKISLELSENIFEKYELQKQIEKTKQRKIWLNCGGFITIDQTEALVAIDVNSGKFTGKSTLEETVYKVNYEATIEIAKQLRLRDIGGIIIIDYIDMQKQENKEKIEKLLKESLKQDRAKTQVEGFTKLNLMELTRKHICSHNS